MGEEKIFLEGNKESSAAAAGAATAVQDVKSEENRFLDGKTDGSTGEADAASAEHRAAPAPVSSEKSSSSGLSSEAAVAAPGAEPAPSPDAQKNPLAQKVIDEALKKCFDPEIPVNIWELGLIYDVNVSPEGLANVKMTLTAPACPVAGSLPGEVETKIKAIPGITDAKVELVWEPPWNPEMMSRVAKVMLGM
jgi:FeS assembly SUF system protein